MRSRTRLGRTVAAGSVIAAVLALPSPARADAAFTLTTSADGVSLVVSNQSFPVVSSIQVNAPSAKATLNSRGLATGYSAVPDPGMTVAELPTTAGATLCTQIPVALPGCDALSKQVPAYPYAYAQTGDKPQDKALPTGHLHAEATSIASTAQTISGGNGAAQASSTTHTQANADGTQDATADTAVDGLVVGDTLRLAGIHATAVLHRAADGTLTKSSSFAVGDLTIAGMEVAFKDGSFTLLGSTIPLPIPVQTVFDALKAIGVTATYLPAQSTSNGVTSAGLSLSYQVQGAPSGVVPPLPSIPQLPVSVGVPTTPTTVTFQLGLVSVQSTFKAIPAVGDTTVTDVVPPLPSTPSASAAAPSPLASDAPAVVTPPVDTSGGGQAIADPGLSQPSPAAAQPQVAPADPGTTTPSTQAASFRAKPVTVDSADIYLAIVAAALLCFGGASAIRILGVRSAWTS